MTSQEELSNSKTSEPATQIAPSAAQSVKSLPHQSMPAAEQSGKSSKSFIAIGIGIAALILLIIGLALFLHSKKQRETDNTMPSQLTDVKHDSTTADGSRPSDQARQDALSIRKKTACDDAMASSMAAIQDSANFSEWVQTEAAIEVVDELYSEAGSLMGKVPDTYTLTQQLLIVQKRRLISEGISESSLQSTVEKYKDVYIAEDSRPAAPGTSRATVRQVDSFVRSHRAQIAPALTACSSPDTAAVTTPSSTVTTPSPATNGSADITPAGGFVDNISISNTGKSPTVSVNGWAADLSGRRPAESVLVTIDGQQLCEAKVGDARPDVAGVHGVELANSGWHCVSGPLDLAPGVHRVEGWASWHEGLKVVKGPLGDSKTFRSE